MNRTAVVKELVVLARELSSAGFSEVDDVTLEQLRDLGGWSFSPMFVGGKSFIWTKDGIFVRGPYGSETFRLILYIRHAFLELGLGSAPQSVKDAFDYCRGNYLVLFDKLVQSRQYHTKKIS